MMLQAAERSPALTCKGNTTALVNLAVSGSLSNVHSLMAQFFLIGLLLLIVFVLHLLSATIAQRQVKLIHHSQSFCLPTGQDDPESVTNLDLQCKDEVFQLS